jgi:AcrR family transcriptional regulator
MAGQSLDSFGMGKTASDTAGTPHGNRKKAEIIDAAMALFATRGYRGASLASIAESVDLTQPGLLHHFRSKAELLVAVLNERDRRDKEELDARFDRTGVGIFQSLESLVEHNAHARDMVRLFTVLVGEAAVSDTHPAHEHFASRYSAIAERLAGLIEQGKELNEVGTDVDTNLVARVLIAVMDGLQIQWLLDPTLDMASDFRAFCALLTRAISETDSPGSSTE